MSTGPSITPSQFCPRCSVEISGELAECPHCHAPQGELRPEPDDRGSLGRYLDNRWILLGLLFFVSAGFGLPFLWKSRAFGLFGKTVLTIIMIVYTWLILWLILILVKQIYDRFEELFRTW